MKVKELEKYGEKVKMENKNPYNICTWDEKSGWQL